MPATRWTSITLLTYQLTAIQIVTFEVFVRKHVTLCVLSCSVIRPVIHHHILLGETNFFLFLGESWEKMNYEEKQPASVKTLLKADTQ